MKKTFIIMAAAALFAGCTNSGKVPGIDLANLDPETRPGDDFYQYATGGWQMANPLKPEFSRYGAFDILAENNEKRLNELFQGLVKSKAAAGTDERKIADLYNMGLDSLRLNAEGATPVLKYLKALDEVNDIASAARACAEPGGPDGAYSSYVAADLMDSDWNVLYLEESGLALGNRDYYLLDEHAEAREGYVAFLEKIFTLAGYEAQDAEQIAKDAFGFEMKIAVPFWSMVQQRDIAAQYNPMSTEELTAKYPHLALAEYFSAMGIGPQKKIIVGQPSYFEALDRIYAKADPVELRHFLQAQLLCDACSFLSDDFSDASFEFFRAQLSGVQEQKPRWKRALAVPNSILGEAVGKLYVAKYFPEQDKERMMEIVKNLQASLGEHITALDWMGEQTKTKALEKLASFTLKIGYPDKWKDYSTLVIDPRKSYLDNMREVSRWYSADNLSELGKPVDRQKWEMTPQTVNAYYNPTTNEICFPAGILQPPFFNHDADDAVNYGAIGVVIGHEMTHGFDDQGRLFDKDGNLADWWTKEDDLAFKAKTAVLVDQFNKVEVLPGVFANGEATLGENIADQGGLRVAFTAMCNSFGDNHPEPVDGFTAQQRFYLGYANVWAQNITDKEKQRRVLMDVHSIGEDRVNATVRNLQSFFDAFAISEGDPMWRSPEERVVIW